MDIDMKSWLFDIINAIQEIEGFIPDQSFDFNAYKRDLRTRRAVELNIEIIGEAVHRLLQKDDGIALTHARKIVDTRNRIIHGYDSVSDEVIGGIINIHLPVLKSEASILLNN